MYETCPKCGYTRTAADTAPKTECPSCGVQFAKWMQARFRREESAPVATGVAATGPGAVGRLLGYVLYVPDETERVMVYLRAVLYLGLFVWGWQFIFMEYYKEIDGHRIDLPVPEIGTSFMHAINTPFHEAGHVIFGPFGRLIGKMGGTIFQILFPFIVLLVFLVKQRDTFAASVGLWWVAQNFMDAAPYINDARNMQLVLIGGGTGRHGRGDLHDWHGSLMELNLLHLDHQIADAVDAIGVVLMLLAFAWGAIVLYRMHRSAA